jgi:23S rRNA (pseudouridine1915-N3)-methyltransferase
MKIICSSIGKTAFDYLSQGIALYEKRLKHYTHFEFEMLPDIKKVPSDVTQLKVKEGEQILEKISKDDFLVLLDEGGKQYSSVAFSDFLAEHQLRGTRRLVFQIGGAYGFSEAVYQRADAQVSLSKMTFSHQMVRLFFVEQLYRAFTILKGEKYHNV